jgi:hypothetical protein
LAKGTAVAGGTLGEALISAWKQVLVEERLTVELDGRTYRVSRTRSQALRTVEVVHQDRHLEGIEQNPNTASRWAKLAQEGKRIMQFRFEGRYVANVCEGELLRYPSWKAKGLPE